MNMDDRDVTQLFPLREDQWERGVMILAHDRQFAHARDSLTVYPPEQTDPFIMYTKACLLMSSKRALSPRHASPSLSTVCSR